ncbi:MAG: sugar phosphate isomerase/epimerase family protein [Pirellulales bacterium]
MFRNLSADGLGISGQQSELIELALSYGFQAIDLDMSEFMEEVEIYGLPHARRMLDSARIRVGQFQLPIQWDEWEEDEAKFKRELERLAKIAEIAVSLGCAHCLTTVRPASDERPYHENFEFHRRRLGEIAEVLQPHGIGLGVGFQAPAALRQGRAFQFIHTFDALVQLIKSAVAENVGAIVDTWQLHVGGGKLDEVRSLTGSQIAAVVLSDIAVDVDLETVDESARLVPGDTGVIDNGAALAVAGDLGFDGPITVRASRRSFPDTKRDRVARLVRDRLDAIRSAAEPCESDNLPASTSS